MDIDTLTADFKPRAASTLPNCAGCAFWQQTRDQAEMNGAGQCLRHPVPVPKFGNGACGDHSELEEERVDAIVLGVANALEASLLHLPATSPAPPADPSKQRRR